MRLMRQIFAAAGACIFVVGIAAAAANAQASRTFVSGHGTDTGGCAVTAPCRSFAYAVTQTAPGGEIVVLDSAGYGAVTIGQSLTITNPGGVEAGITATSGSDAITIDTSGTGAANVTLRGLTLEGAGTGANGIYLSSVLPDTKGSGGSLNILGCVVKDFTTAGIGVVPTVASGGGGAPFMLITVTDSVFLNNTDYGLFVQPQGDANLYLSIYRTVADGNGYGIFAAAAVSTVTGLMVSSAADNNILGGIAVGSGASLIMKQSTATNTITPQNGDVYVQSNAVLIVYNNNTIHVLNNSGATITDGSNNIDVANGDTLAKLSPK